MPEMRSVSVGIWIKAGSAFESDIDNGVSHLIEHMLFKGTFNRTAKELADEIDGIGGQINAFTSKDCTCYYVKVINSHLEIGIEVLSDMICNSKFDEIELTKEKKIIYDEIALYEDSPEDVVYDLLSETIFKNEGLGQPILGTEENLEKMSRDQILSYLKTHYTPDNIVISVAGSFNREELLTYLEKSFCCVNGKKQKEQSHSCVFNSGYQSKYKDIEQYHLCIGLRGVSYDDVDIYPLMVLNNLLGGGTSSRLFQNVREDKGLAYSIYSHPSQYNGIGLMTIYASFIPENLIEIIDSIKLEIQNFLALNITDEELERSKEQLKGNYILGLESTGSIMSMLGKSLLMSNRIETLDEVIDSIEAVSFEDVERMIKLAFNKENLAITLVGRVTEEETKKIYNELKGIHS